MKLSASPQVAGTKGPLCPQGQARAWSPLDRRLRGFSSLEQFGEEPDAFESPYPYGEAAGEHADRGQLHRWFGDLSKRHPTSFSKLFSTPKLTTALPQQLHLKKARNRCSSGEDGEPGTGENAVFRGRSRSFLRSRAARIGRPLGPSSYLPGKVQDPI